MYASYGSCSSSLAASTSDVDFFPFFHDPFLIETREVALSMEAER
jgi:hypothetical protein